jgi:hypothetical protein
MSATAGEFAGLRAREVARRCSRSELKSARERNTEGRDVTEEHGA